MKIQLAPNNYLSSLDGKRATRSHLRAQEGEIESSVRILSPADRMEAVTAFLHSKKTNSHLWLETLLPEEQRKDLPQRMEQMLGGEVTQAKEA